MVTEKSDASSVPESFNTPEAIADEVNAAIEELKAAQAKLDEIKAKAAAETREVSEGEVTETVGVSTESENAPSVAAAVEATEVPGSVQGTDWVSYTPSAESAIPPVSNGYTETAAAYNAGAQGAPVYEAAPSSAYNASTPYNPTQVNEAYNPVAYGTAVPPMGNDPYAQAPYYAPTQNGGYQYQAPPQNPQQQYYYQQPYQQQTISSKDHVAAGLLGIFLGSLGIHKFYLGYNTPGFIMLAVTILGSVFTFGIAAAVMWLIGVIEGIVYLTKSQSEFEQIYVFNKREWF